MFIDTHAHLNFDSEYPDLDQVISDAKKSGVGKIIVVGADLLSSERAVELAKKYENLYATVGLHPTDHEIQKDDILKLEKLAGMGKVVAIGEAGLDYFRLENEQDKDIQKELFLKQIELANNLNLPIIIHSREADDDMISILNKVRSEKPNLKGAIHCFSGDSNFAKLAIDLGFYISFTGIITYPRTEKIAEALMMAPLDKIMIETDCPFLAPQLYRGKRNEPSYVIEVAKKVALLKARDLKDIEKITTKNAEDFFRI